MCARPMAIPLAVGRTAGSWRCQIRSIRMRCINNHKTTKENIPTTCIFRINRDSASHGTMMALITGKYAYSLLFMQEIGYDTNCSSLIDDFVCFPIALTMY